jgi:hypothetical protein
LRLPGVAALAPPRPRRHRVQLSLKNDTTFSLSR